MCAIRLVHCYPRDASEMWQITFHCATSFLDNWDIYREEVEQESISGSRPENEASMTDLTILNRKHLKSLLLRYLRCFLFRMRHTKRGCQNVWYPFAIQARFGSVCPNND